MKNKRKKAVQEDPLNSHTVRGSLLYSETELS